MFRSLNWALCLNTFRKNTRLPKDRLDAIQCDKLRRLVQHAYENVPYYRDLLSAAGVKPDQIRNTADLGKIPTTSKLTLQSLNPGDQLVQNAMKEGTISDVTSGSTGIPLKVCFSREDYDIRSIIFIRSFMEMGYKLSDRQAIVCDTRFLSNHRYWFQNLGIFRKLYIPVQSSLDHQIRALREYNPDHIHGYARSLALIAEEMLRQNITDVAPSLVCTGAELVSRKTRETINRAFHVDMLDMYASIESGLIAWECAECRRYHINSDGLVVEFLRNGKPCLPGEPGMVVITNLHSYAMPIIRYEIGDIGIPSADLCSCGRALPLMEILEGRIDDMVYTPSGKVISPNSITNALEAAKGIAQFRVIQKTREQLKVLFVPDASGLENVSIIVQRLLEELVGPDMRIDIQSVESLPREYTGKIRAVICELPNKDRQFISL
jgi:phenylacetate-CoA ligase